MDKSSINKLSYVKLENFEGPFDLLLFFVKNSKINANDIFISEITRQFLNGIDFETNLDIDLYSNFILTISILIYIKSKSLLPMEIELDEEIDERNKLAEGLVEYKKYKQAAKVLMGNFENEKILIRNDSQIELIIAFTRLTKEIDTSIFKVLEIEKISIDDKIEEINDYLFKNDELMFSSLFSGESTKYELIITFLALLELVKMKKILILQHKLFGDIKIIKR